MNNFEREIDSIDMELYRLAEKASALATGRNTTRCGELFIKIREARSVSYSMLPQSQKAYLNRETK